MVKILDAKYIKADLPKVVHDNCAHLDSVSDQHKDLLSLLVTFDELLDGTLGDWKTEHDSLEIKEGANLSRGRSFARRAPMRLMGVLGR